jgi:hypothetical protein
MWPRGDKPMSEVYAVKAGRELDALVAEKVMGWKPVQIHSATDCYDDEHGISKCLEFHQFSTDIACAWQVVEKLEVNFLFDIDNWNDQWKCTVLERGNNRSWTAREKTFPLAICLAALKAYGVEVPA